jgi:hypothetical protein
MYQCEIDATASAGAAGAFLGSTGGPSSRAVISNNYFHGNFSNAPFNNGANTMLEMFVQNNTFVQRNAVASIAMSFVSGSSGVIAYNNLVAGNPANLVGCISAPTNLTLNFLQNYVYFQKAGPFSGILCPAVGTIP